MTPWLPLLILITGAAFEVYCLVALVRARQVRHLPKWAWGLLCVCCNPLGGITFLVLGRGA